jgi:hypothetical protein
MPEITKEKLQQLAKKAAVDWRTLANVLAGMEVRGTAGERARAALKAAGLIK